MKRSGPASFDDQRAARIMRRLIDTFALDLSGLTVMTEAATGAYAYCTVLTAMAGAKVCAVARDSKFASAATVAKRTKTLLKKFRLERRVEVLARKTPEAIARCDVFTNTANLRPIDAAMIARMRDSAVVSLMWEPWEFRAQDLDLGACRERGILVLGTDETTPPNDLFRVPGFLALKLLYSLGLEGYKNRVMLLGGGKLGRSIFDFLGGLGVEVEWFAGDHSAPRPYRTLPAYWRKQGAQCDAVLLAELSDESMLIGRGGLLSPAALAKVNPSTGVGVFAGRCDAVAMRKAGIRVMPEDVRPRGYMSYQSYHLGLYPVLQLHAAGLKVGEAMARARKSGLSVHAAARRAVESSPALDFPGELAWIR